MTAINTRSVAKSFSEAERWAMAAWIVLVGVVLVRSWLTPSTHSVYPVYVQAARAWLAGEAIYGNLHQQENIDAFRYPPPLAVLFVPFTFIPDNVGGICWRVLCLAVYLGGFVGLCKLLWPDSGTGVGISRALLGFGLIPLSIGSLNNGQANVLIIGMLLAAGTLLQRRLDLLAAGCLALASITKVYPAAVALLFLALRPRRLGLPYLVSLAAFAALPFLCQQPEYVISQYRAWWASTFTDLPSAGSLHLSSCDLGSLLRAMRVHPSREAYGAVQIGAGLAIVAILLWRSRRGWSDIDLVRGTLDLGCSWLVLLGPFTESCTYVVSAPTLAWSVAENWRRSRLRTFWVLLALSCFLAAMLEKSLGLGKTYPSMAHVLYPAGGMILFLERVLASPSLPKAVRSR